MPESAQPGPGRFPIAEALAAIVFAVALITVIVVMVGARPAVVPPADRVPRMTAPEQIR